MKADMRTASNYRVYGTDSLLRLRFIRAAQSSGFTLENIGALLRMREGTGDVCGSVKHLIEDRLEKIEEDLTELRRVRKVLRSTLAWCENPRVKGRCQVLDDLDAQSAGARPTTRRRTRKR